MSHRQTEEQVTTGLWNKQTLEPWLILSTWKHPTAETLDHSIETRRLIYWDAISAGTRAVLDLSARLELTWHFVVSLNHSTSTKTSLNKWISYFIGFLLVIFATLLMSHDFNTSMAFFPLICFLSDVPLNGCMTHDLQVQIKSPDLNLNLLHNCISLYIFFIKLPQLVKVNDPCAIRQILKSKPLVSLCLTTRTTLDYACVLTFKHKKLLKKNMRIYFQDFKKKFTLIFTFQNTQTWTGRPFDQPRKMYWQITQGRQKTRTPSFTVQNRKQTLLLPREQSCPWICDKIHLHYQTRRHNKPSHIQSSGWNRKRSGSNPTCL